MNEKVIKNWLSLADYDLETAKKMLEAKRYLYVAFTCHQAIEKLLKAIYVKEIQETPPYTHNLIRLANNLSIYSIMDAEKIKFVEILNSYYIESRYSEEIEELSNNLTKKKAIDLYSNTKDLFLWLKKKV